MLIVLSAAALVIISVILILTVRENVLRRAEFFGNGFQFDGMTYQEISFREIEPYTETYKAVCKTTDGAWTLYEIKEFPDREYLVARVGWEASVIKRIE